ncbi:MAG: GNAT family N-acetyltransferase [Variovorax sp.]
MIHTRLANYNVREDAADVVRLLDAYARDPAGGGKALAPAVLARLPQALAARPQAFSVLAFDGEAAVGLVNCFEGFSTFAARPLVNIHDVIVMASHRGRRIAPRMLERVETEACARGACKLTLEVLGGNAAAMKAYVRQGFAHYTLDPALGHAVFLQKPL